MNENDWQKRNEIGLSRRKFFAASGGGLALSCRDFTDGGISIFGIRPGKVAGRTVFVRCPQPDGYARPKTAGSG